MNSAAVLIGGDVRAMYYLYGWLTANRTVQRARGIHAGAIACALWATRVSPIVLEAAAQIPMALYDWLNSVLPHDAHTTCSGRITVGVCRRGWVKRGRVCKATRWATRDALLQTLCSSVATHPVLNWQSGYCTAALAADIHVMLANATVVEARARNVAHIRSVECTSQCAKQWIRDGHTAGTNW